jgi:hypothetical protein
MEISCLSFASELVLVGYRPEDGRVPALPLAAGRHVVVPAMGEAAWPTCPNGHQRRRCPATCRRWLWRHPPAGTGPGGTCHVSPGQGCRHPQEVLFAFHSHRSDASKIPATELARELNEFRDQFSFFFTNVEVRLDTIDISRCPYPYPFHFCYTIVSSQGKLTPFYLTLVP